MADDVPPLELAQNEAAKVMQVLAEARQRLKERRAEMADEVDETPEEMVSWKVCPSVSFFVDGLLSLAIADLEIVEGYLYEAAESSANTVRWTWEESRHRAEARARKPGKRGP